MITRTISLILCLVLFCPAIAHANIRAPRTIPQHAMHELDGAQANLRVLGEKLTIVCDSDCAVEAVYRIDAAIETDAELDFIAPVTGPVEISSGEKRISAQLIPAEVPERDGKSSGNIPGTKLSRAEFSFHFPKGETALKVRYIHHPGQTEQGQSYTSDGHMVKNFEYELWPLAEWQLAPDFQLDMSVTFQRAKPSFLSRVFANEKAPFCSFTRTEHDGGTTETIKSRRSESGFAFEKTFPADFPKVLYCSFGE